MGKRHSIAQHAMAYHFIAARDGESCLLCSRKPLKVKLEIDHADNNPKNNAPDNLHLLCKTDNLLMRQKTVMTHKRIIRKAFNKRQKERELERGFESTHRVKDLVDYKSGSTEMQANSYFETKFREWILNVIIDNGFIIKKEAVNSGAEMAGCSPITTARYLSKMTGSIGNLKEATDGMGVKIIKFK